MRHFSSTLLVLSSLLGLSVAAGRISKDGTCGGKGLKTCIGSGLLPRSKLHVLQLTIVLAMAIVAHKVSNLQYSYCGSNQDYCGTGCQSAFGICSGLTSSPSSPAPASTPSQKVSTNAQCGSFNGGRTCLGSAWGDCCSQYGYCGSTNDYCSVENKCQAGFGKCNTQSSSAQSSTTIRSSTVSSTSQVTSTLSTSTISSTSSSPSSSPSGTSSTPVPSSSPSSTLSTTVVPSSSSVSSTTSSSALVSSTPVLSRSSSTAAVPISSRRF